MSDAQLVNLGSWSVQAGVLTLAAIGADRLLRVDAPGARYAWWRIVLLVCLALPVLQPWRAQPPLSVETVIVGSDATAETTPPMVTSVPVPTTASAKMSSV